MSLGMAGTLMAMSGARRSWTRKIQSSSARRFRRGTRSVKVGLVVVGSEHPLVIQTMTTCPTSDPEMVREQISRCADAGVEVVRVTVQGLKEAKALGKLRAAVGNLPVGLVADIHFKPAVALAVADHVDKVRINPGNFVDGVKTFDALADQDEAEMVRRAKEQMRSQLVPLVEKLKTQKKALRIGVNHGSLSERILRQYGDSPEGMVASALEVVEICREQNFHDIIISMKSSNVKVMIAAYRLLVQSLAQRGSDWNYPLHLGVTEAGAGADGRIKSAVGIGTLLVDGIGDTIRVSLTEDPWLEAPSCRALAEIHREFTTAHWDAVNDATQPTNAGMERRVTNVEETPLHREASVLVTVTKEDMENEEYACREILGYRRDQAGHWVRTDEAADAAVVDEWDAAFQKLIDADIPVIIRSPSGRVSPPEAAILCLSSDAAVAVPDKAVSSKRRYAVVLNGMETEETLRNLVEKAFVKFFILRPEKFAGSTYIEAGRKVGNLMNKWRAKQPIILDFETKRSENWEYDLIYGAVLMGAVLVDGFAQGVLWQQRRLDSFSLLQACRLRASKTEFISCPSCGRTLFDLQQTTERIKQRTGHLPGVRIAVMGCIVNGPGEMADADFGFVGSLPGKVDLYYGKNCVRRGVDYADADEVLVQLIKDHGLWKDPLPA